MHLEENQPCVRSFLPIADGFLIVHVFIVHCSFIFAFSISLGISRNLKFYKLGKRMSKETWSMY